MKQSDSEPDSSGVTGSGAKCPGAIAVTTILAFNSSSIKEKYKKKQSISANADVVNVNSQHDRPSAEIIIYPGIRRERLNVTDNELEPATDLYSVKFTHNN